MSPRKRSLEPSHPGCPSWDRPCKICTPTVDDLDVSEPLIVDGTLLPTWSWRTMPELYSGKHKTTGVNVQVACDLTGRLAFISDPMPGRTHDAHALKETGLLDHITTGQLIGDKGYIGLGMITPIRTQPKQQHTEEEKRFNKSVNAIRYMIERVIANLKTWRILHTERLIHRGVLISPNYRFTSSGA